MTESIFANKEVVTRMKSQYPLGLGNVSNIADAVSFLLSGKASWITGQQLTVDGGATIDITG
jgi:NAD(P)-dependent dehydrogenase (short-subunit alcohol dehydrogenase family)